jgi:hypothetical protein
MNPSANLFKFACPSCNQHIEIGAEFESRRVACPSCNAPLIVPTPKSEGEVPVATRAQPAARPTPAPTATSPQGVSTETKSAAPVAASAPVARPEEPAPTPVADQPVPPPDEAEGGVKPVARVAPISDTRVVMLTPQFKLEIVRDVRSRLADKSRWLPGKKEGGEYNYAARQEGEKLVPVSPTDASATHLSLFGAVLLEFHRHNVMGVTAGRREFLDEELIAAIHEVLGRQPGEPPISEADREALTHEQCLKALDLMAGRYQREADAAEKKEAHRKIENIRLSDLVSKLENRAPIRPEDVACALYYELEDIRQRLEALERPTKSGD